jgi:hypothetical protein
LSKNPDITDVSYHYANGQVVKYLPFEIETLSRDVDPILAVVSPSSELNFGAVIMQLATKVCLPLVLIDSLEFNKEQGSIVNVLVRNLRSV